jgi:hypothetical protein
MNDLKHYLALGTILSLGFGLFWYFRYLREVQVVITLLMAGAYVLWGVIHHSIKKDLHWQVVVEYVAVAAVASVPIISLLLRS